jgi:hypothetical protein
VADAEGTAPDDPDADPTLPGVRTLAATTKQIGQIKGHYHRLGVEDRLTQLSWTSQLLDGRSLGSHKDLNRGEASRLIDLLSAAKELG